MATMARVVTVLSVPRDAQNSHCSSYSGTRKFQCPTRATWAMRFAKFSRRQLQVPLNVAILERTEGTCLPWRRKFVSSEQSGVGRWNRPRKEGDPSATSGFWSSMVLGGGAKAFLGPSAAHGSVRGIADEPCRGRGVVLRWAQPHLDSAGWKRTVQFMGAAAHVRASSSIPGEAIVARPSSVRRLSKSKELVADERLAVLRSSFENAGDGGIDAYIIPSEDPHQVTSAPHLIAEKLLAAMFSKFPDIHASPTGL